MSWLQNPDRVLLLLVEVSCLVTALSTRALPKAQRRKLHATAAVVMVVGGVAYAATERGAGYVAAAAYLLLLLVPGLLVSRAARFALGRRYRLAAWLTRAAWVLKPWSELSAVAAFYTALESDCIGRRDEALAQLEQVGRSSSKLANEVAITRFAILDDWAGLRAHVEAKPGEVELSILPAYIRALGECGDPPAMFRAAEHARKRLEATWARTLCDLIRLYIFAFAGRRLRVAELFEGPFRHMRSATRALWLATAEITAGDPEAGLARLAASQAEALPAEATVYHRRAHAPPPLATTVLGEAELRVLADLEDEWEGERRYASDAGEQIRPVATWALVAVILAVYALEVGAGGPTNEAALTRLGVLMLDRVGDEPWRILTAQFLHYGPVHLGFNVLGLLSLGGFVERKLGRARYLLTYLLSGTFALGLWVLLVRIGVSAPATLLGASGNILGVVGASAAIMAHGFWTRRAKAARRRLVLMTSIVVGQAVFDLLVPGTSFAGHAFGAVFGFVLAGLMIGMTAVRSVMIGTAALALSVAAERVTSMQTQQRLACFGSDLDACEASCRDGMSEACLTLAERFRQGVGVEVDEARALSLERLACDQGRGDACYNVGVAVFGAGDSAQDVAAAMDWFRKACALGEPLGWCEDLNDTAQSETFDTADGGAWIIKEKLPEEGACNVPEVCQEKDAFDR